METTEILSSVADLLRHKAYSHILRFMQELTKERVLKIMEDYGNDPQQLIAVLLDIQAASGKNCVEQQWAELAEEVIREDYSNEGPAIREALLKRLQVAEIKPKVTKAAVSFKVILLEGIQGLGGTTTTFSEIFTKLDENQIVLQNKKQGFIEKVKRLFQQMLNKEPDPIIYDVEYMDPVKGIPVRETS